MDVDSRLTDEESELSGLHLDLGDEQSDFSIS